jgi:hypothetical protein
MFQHSETGNITFLDNITAAKLFGETNVRWGEAIPLYAQPTCQENRHVAKNATCEWVGLSREEILDIEETTTHPLQFYRAVEAQLKEKNT